MKPWYSTPDRIAALVKAAAAWRGTPFLGNSCSRGPRGGVSCQMLAAALYRESGFGAIDAPGVPMSHGAHQKESILTRYMEGRPDFVPIAVREKPVMPGDLLGFRIGGTTHHMGVALEEGTFIHAIEGRGTVVSLLSDPTWKARLTHQWRPVENEQERKSA